MNANKAFEGLSNEEVNMKRALDNFVETNRNQVKAKNLITKLDTSGLSS